MDQTLTYASVMLTYERHNRQHVRFAVIRMSFVLVW